MSKPWTEAEKLGILFEIIEQSGPIRWSTLTLPEGRTQKAVIVMLDREKGKVRKARAEACGEGEEGGETPKPKGGNKRKANGDGDATPQKPKTPRKKKETVEAGSDKHAGAAGEQDEQGVKPESEEDEGDIF